MHGLVKIGKLTRLHGIKGALLLHLDSGPGPDVERLKTLFLDINGTPTPFFLSEIKAVGKNLAVSFDTVSAAAEAQKLAGKEVWIEAAFLRKEKKRADLSGYLLVDDERGEIGTVIEMIDSPGQRLLSVKAGEKEVLLPFNEDLVRQTDHKKKIVYYSAPAGLIDIFLG